jgi:hypothetical protein
MRRGPGKRQRRILDALEAHPEHRPHRDGRKHRDALAVIRLSEFAKLVKGGR